MRENTITQLPDPSGFSSDPFTDVLRDGACKLIEQANHAELSVLMNAYSGETLEDGRARLVRHGHLPEREVMTGIGPVPVKVPRVRDRSADEDKVTFTPSILPRYLRKAKSIEELLPWLYLKGVSTGDFTEALEALLGPNAKGLSAKTVTRLKADWWQDYEAWQKRDLGSRRFLYIWADGVYLQARMEENAECMLVIIGATPEGKKELIGFQVGLRESSQSWHELLSDIKARGLSIAPKIAVGDGAFYGPKIEYTLKDALGRQWQCGTIQVDPNLPERLDAEFVGEDGVRHRPVMLHRAIVGSLERFIGILIEQHAGALPTWLAPTQVAVLNITDAQADYVRQVAKTLQNQGLRVVTDLRNEKITYKIREHALQKLPFIVVVGDKEMAAGAVAVRARGNQDLGVMSLEAFAQRVATDVAARV